MSNKGKNKRMREYLFWLFLGVLAFVAPANAGEMVPIPAGAFQMGSEEAEAWRAADNPLSWSFCFVTGFRCVHDARRNERKSHEDK